MDRSALERRIRRLDREHRSDRDGGYGLVAAMIRERAALGEEDRRRLDELLLSWVEDRDSDLWGVSLEALTQAGVQAGVQRLGSRLLDLLSQTRDPEIGDDLTRSLLRLGIDGRACREHIERSLRRGRPETILFAGLLHRLDPEKALTLGGEYFARKLRKAGAVDEVRGYIPGMVQLLAEESAEPLVDLVRRVGARRPAASDRLQELILDYVSRPWAERSLGAPRIEEIRRALS